MISDMKIRIIKYINGDDKIMEKLLIQKKCIVCGAVKVIEVDREGYELWLSGMLIQDALPNLSVNDREMLISSICSTCYDAFDEDESEYEGEKWNDL